MRLQITYIVLFSLTCFCLRGQAVPPVVRTQDIPEVRVEPDFARKYQQALSRLRRVYPLALQAKSYLIEFEKQYQEIEARRKKKQLGRKSYKILKDQFVYDIRDLYISEGIMLMKLVHRETNQTVSEIIQKYRGQLNANMYEGIGKIWEQDLGIKYDPYGEDYITEIVINDIINKRVAFNWDVKPLNKEEFRHNQKDYREDVRESRKEKRLDKKYKKVKRSTKGAAEKTD